MWPHPCLHGQSVLGCVSQTHAHIHKYVLREIPMPVYTMPLLHSFPGASFQVALAQSVPPFLPAPNDQTASWRNKCSWTVRASLTPETPAKSANVRKAMPTASLGPAPGPPVPTRCLVPAVRTTAMVRWMGWGRGSSGIAWPPLWEFRAGEAAYPEGHRAPPRPLAAPSPRMCLWRERVPQWSRLPPPLRPLPPVSLSGESAA